MKQEEREATTKVTLSLSELDALHAATLGEAESKKNVLLQMIRDNELEEVAGRPAQQAIAEIDMLVAVAKRLERALLRLQVGKRLQ